MCDIFRMLFEQKTSDARRFDIGGFFYMVFSLAFYVESCTKCDWQLEVVFAFHSTNCRVKLDILS